MLGYLTPPPHETGPMFRWAARRPRAWVMGVGVCVRASVCACMCVGASMYLTLCASMCLCARVEAFVDEYEVGCACGWQ
ncbi:hypothetical protein BKA56DRAFT_577424 [Ilyonectria sp. MPI-CAGE-AT-0026]|nr:hypothetical protein BKA56DRAFT_577424 [Ilyonectria sp. MPI-CAGE-AT-0026]